MLSPRVFLLRGHCLVISIVAGPSQVLNPAHFISFYIYHKRQKDNKIPSWPGLPQHTTRLLVTFHVLVLLLYFFSTSSSSSKLILQRHHLNTLNSTFVFLLIFYLYFLIDLWLPLLIFRQFETCSLLLSPTFLLLVSCCCDCSTLKSQQRKLKLM